MTADVATTLNGWNSTAGSNQPDNSDAVGPNTLAENLRTIQAVVRDAVAGNGTIASATTTDLSTVNDGYINVTGTTTITGLGTLTAGIVKILKFAGALTFTHNGTSLILPGAADITTAAGDVAIMRSEGSGNWRCLMFMRASGAALLGGGGNAYFAVSGPASSAKTFTFPNADSTVQVAGQQTIWIPAGAMTARTTNGAASGTAETTTNKVMLKTLDFDASTAEYAQFSVRMPKSWNESTVTAYFLWSNASGTGDVVWGLQGVALSDDDALDAAFGTAQTVTDSVTAAGDLMQSAATSAITIAGTPAAGDWVVFQAYRDAANGSDTLASDARLHGVVVIYTTDAANDA